MPAEIATLTKAVNTLADTAKSTVTYLTQGGAASPAAVFKGAHVIALAHPLAALSLVGGLLALLGLARQRLKNQQAKPVEEPAPPAAIW